MLIELHSAYLQIEFDFKQGLQPYHKHLDFLISLKGQRRLNSWPCFHFHISRFNISGYWLSISKKSNPSHMGTIICQYNL